MKKSFFCLAKNIFFLGFLLFWFYSCVATNSQGYIIPQAAKNKVALGSKSKNVQYTREQMDGIASWYGPNFHGKKTANGKIYNQNAYTVAHRILPLGSKILITNLENNKKIVALVNDRGPYKKNRIVDVSKRIATELGFLEQGTARVKLDIISYPKNYNPKSGIEPYKQKVVQIVAYKNKRYAQNNIQKIKKKLHPIPIFVDQPKKGEYHIVVGPFYSEKKAKLVSNKIQKKGFNSFVRSYRK